MRIAELTLHRVDLPLTTPYRLSYRTFETFEPIVVEARGDDGRIGWGEQHISPGSSAETREGGWAFANEFAGRIVGMEADEAIQTLLDASENSKVAAASLVNALEMLAHPDRFETETETRLPLLTPFNAMDMPAIAEEVEQRLESGFRTFKIKVGKDVEADLKRVSEIQRATAGRATLRIDANRAYNRDQGIAFASAIEPDCIELFEQPCDSDDWDANAAVAAVSKVPLMLDEPICTLPDIDRAAAIEGVGLCKVKLKRFVSAARLEEAILRVKATGMDAVLGDGLGAEINCWMEAAVANRTIDNAGEYNGYLKVRPEMRLLQIPLAFEDGNLVLPAGYWPEMDRDRLAARTLKTARHAPASVAGA